MTDLQIIENSRKHIEQTINQVIELSKYNNSTNFTEYLDYLNKLLEDYELLS